MDDFVESDVLKHKAAPLALDARQRRSRQSLRDAILALVERHPLERITIRNITAEAGIGYATFFRHYASKEALLDDIAFQELEALVAKTLPLLDGAAPRASCVALCSFVMEHRQLWTALLGGGAASTMREVFTRISREVAVGRTSPESARWLPPELGIHHATGSIIELLSWWLRQEEPLEAERMGEIIDRLVIAPLHGVGG